jgi:hypothetical protein
VIVSLTIRCDWPGCRERLTYDFATLRPQAPGWKTESDHAYSLRLCPPHNRKSWDAVKEAIAATAELPRAAG